MLVAPVDAAGLRWTELSEQARELSGTMAIGTMHQAKGLEFKAALVMACDDGVLPLQARLEAVADETELDDVYETERHLLYVACTRARDRLMLSGVSPGSEFLQDLGLSGRAPAASRRGRMETMVEPSGIEPLTS